MRNCDYSFSQKDSLKKHILSVHEDNLKKHIVSVHEGKKPLKCENCVYSCSQKDKLKKHIATVHEGKKSLKGGNKVVKPQSIGSLNIGLCKKEELLKNTISEHDFDVCSVSEVEIKYFDERKPFSIHGYKTFFPLQRPGSHTKRLICFVKENIDAVQRCDLMHELLSSVWLEIKQKSQKILIVVYIVNLVT